MFGLFKKKDGSKSIAKGKPVQNQTLNKDFQSIKKSKISNTNGKKQQQKPINFKRQDTEGQFVQRRKVQKPSSVKKKDTQSNSYVISTPKIQNKNNLKQLQQKDTERPHKYLNEQNNMKKNKNKIQKEFEQQNYCYEDIKRKQQIDLKLIIKILIQFQVIAQSQNQLLISRQFLNDKKAKDLHYKLFYSKYFRFYSVRNISEIIQRYGQICQGVQILISKLNNRIGKNVHFHKNLNEEEQKLLTIFVSGQSDFLLFFKHFFSKPYTLCNRSSTRKIIQVLWQSVSFKQINAKKLFQQIKLWIYGISIPVNPTLIMLHKVVLKNAQLIPKYAKMIYNDKIYMGVNETDPLIKTPMILAAQTGNKKAVQKLIKCGGDPFLIPCYTKKGQYQFQYSQTKYKKHIFTLKFPQYTRKILSPMQTLLFLKQDYNLLSDCFYFMQLSNIRSLRKNCAGVKQKIQQMPDCTFQISWKTYRGILSFKQLPSDIITVYKKGSMLRIDYNIDSIENPVKGKHFTILIKAENDKQLEFYEIRHHNKSILNRLTSIDMNVIKQRFNEFCSFPQSRYSQISSCNGMYSRTENQQGKKINLSLTLNMQTQLITPQLKKGQDYKKPPYSNITQYENSIIQSQLINYKILDKSQIQATIQQNIIIDKLLPLKLKSKIDKSSIGIQMQLQQQEITLQQISFILCLFQADSLFVSKIQKIIKLLSNQDVFKNINLPKYLPTFTKLSFEKDLTFQINIKNITYMAINDSVFNVECKVVEDMDYEENINPRVLMEMQQTMLSEEGYSINVSQFLGKTQKLLQIQDLFARDKFQKLLEQQYVSNQKFEGNILDQLEDDD